VGKHKETDATHWARRLGDGGHLVFTGTGECYFQAFRRPKTAQRKSGKFQTGHTESSSPGLSPGKLDGEQVISVLPRATAGCSASLWYRWRDGRVTKPVAQGRSFGYLTLPRLGYSSAKR